MENSRIFLSFIKAVISVASTLAMFVGTGALAKSASVPTGPYGAVMEYDSSKLPYQTVYRPRDLTSTAAVKIPIVAWGNGGCAANGGVIARPLLMELASYGYLLIAPGKPAADVADEDMVKIFGPQPEPGKTPPTGTAQAVPDLSKLKAAAQTGSVQLSSRSQSSDLIGAINWAIQENSRKGSIYFNRLDVSKIAVMGHSCGGLQSIDVAIRDPRITTTIVWNSGIFDSTSQSGMTLPDINKDSLKKLHSSIAYIQGGPEDIAYKNALDDFERINNVPAFMGEYGVGHGGTFLKPNGGVYAKVALAWLNWQLKGDKTAGAMFSGEKCGLCTEPYWKVTRKGMK